MRYVILNDAMCDKRIKKLGAEVAYFSKEKLDKIYPPNAADTYSVVGYTALDKADNERNRNQEFTVTVGEGETSFDAVVQKSYHHLLYKNDGYACLGANKYVVILKRRLMPVILLCLALLVVIGVLVYTLRVPEDTKPNVPASEDFPNVTVVEDERSHEEPERGEEISLIYTDNAKIELSTGKITMYFKNPSTCSHDVILELYVLSGEESVKIATSDLIIAGQDLTTMKMETTATKLSEGNYTGMYRLLFFEPGEKTTDPPAQESKITDVDIVVTK